MSEDPDDPIGELIESALAAATTSDQCASNCAACERDRLTRRVVDALGCTLHDDDPDDRLGDRLGDGFMSGDWLRGYRECSARVRQALDPATNPEGGTS